MSNIAEVKVRVAALEKQGEKVENSDFHEPQWAEFVDLFQKASFCEQGQLKGKTDFNLDGAGSYVNSFEFNETEAYMNWLEKQGYTGITLEFVEVETGQYFAGIGRIHGEILKDKVRLTMKHHTWGLQAYLEEHDLLDETGDYFKMGDDALLYAWEHFEEQSVVLENIEDDHMTIFLLPKEEVVA